jgi:acyl-CoA synthetase (AMP-forming)/AMP-acid ligase II
VLAADTETRLEDSFEDRSTTLWRPMPQTDVKVVDPVTEEPVAPGAVGELCARGYGVMAGYNANPEATAAALDAEGVVPHRRSGLDGRPWLPAHRGQAQGHDHPGWRERLPA